VLARGSDQPAFEMAFTQIDYRRPDADQFSFNPPPGVTVTEETAERPTAGKPDHVAPGRDPQVRTVGDGWTTVLVARLDAASAQKPAAAPDADMSKLLGGLPTVSGDWGSGRLLTGKLFSVLLTDDGRVLAGAVTPQRLYQVARG
jgi:hypothetical protein